MNIQFAPLQGYTDSVFRKLHHEIYGGVDTYYTPFVRVERGGFRRRDERELPSEDETYTIPQIIASPVELHMEMLSNLMIERGYKRADVNIGCPYPTVTRKGQGSAMLPHPDQIDKMLEQICKKDGIQWSVKLRLGFNAPDECMQLIDILNRYPLAHITVHPRTAKSEYEGPLDFDNYNAFVSQIKHPVVYNGNLLTCDDIKTIPTNLCSEPSALMIGRGLLKHPYLAAEYQTGKKLTVIEKKEKLREFMSEMLEKIIVLMNGEKQTLAHMKEYWLYLEPNTEKRLRKKIIKANNISNYRSAVSEFIANIEE